MKPSLKVPRLAGLRARLSTLPAAVRDYAVTGEAFQVAAPAAPTPAQQQLAA